MSDQRLGLEGVFPESEIPLPMRRSGMADWRGDHIMMLDRRALPLEEKYLRLQTTEEVACAIEGMAIQGAFSISMAAGYGLALDATGSTVSDLKKLDAAADRLIATRPTGAAVKRMVAVCLRVAEQACRTGTDVQSAIVETVNQGAVALAKQGYETGKHICDLLPDDATILTHCFPDRSYVYLLMESRRRNKTLNIICSETRPYLQGARLTALCAVQAGFEANVITDGMGGMLMQQGKIDAFITAADRVCMDGTVCNKVGTYQYALAARANDVPYYTLRQSGPDVTSLTQDDVEIEYRNGNEIIFWGGQRMAPEGVSGLYPSFDFTPSELVSKIITDRGIFEAADISSYLDTPEVVAGAIV